MKLPRIFVILLSIIVIILFLIVIILSTLLISGEHKKAEEQKFEYKYFERNLEFNDTSRGFLVTAYDLFDGIQEKEYISEVNVNVVSLISKFGSTEYECVGHCYCDDVSSGRRFTYSQTVGKGLIYMLASVSSVVVYEKAKEYFFQECEEQYSSECPKGVIKAEIDECISQLDKLEEKMVSNEAFENQYLHFYCTGNCLINRNIEEDVVTKEQINDDVVSREEREKYECHRISSSKEVVVNVRPDLRGTELLRDDSYRRVVAGGFTKDHLDPFCREASQKVYSTAKTELTRKGGIMKRKKKVIERSFTMCVGYNNLESDNPTVKCEILGTEEEMKMKKETRQY